MIVKGEGGLGVLRTNESNQSTQDSKCDGDGAETEDGQREDQQTKPLQQKQKLVGHLAQPFVVVMINRKITIQWVLEKGHLPAFVFMHGDSHQAAEGLNQWAEQQQKDA